ncbi:hypothetical protein CLOM_g10903 [Closterium sp. NIES-68]|nr:hypothetical protein CLOM_g10903 [Closterium sp. NIES-68]GJP57766.1 hypothetical protein CLOP_g17361 [Closterium sp. NIES-67]
MDKFTMIIETPPRAVGSTIATGSSHQKRHALGTPNADRGTPASAKRALKLSTPRTPSQADRFIPNRGAMDLDMARFNMARDVSTSSGARENSTSHEVTSPNAAQYRKQLAENLLRDSPSANTTPSARPRGAKILSFKPARSPSADSSDFPTRGALFSPADSACASVGKRKAFRYVPQAAERILDAPDLVDDYYLNLLAWSSSNVVALALGASVYLWDAATGGIEELLHVGGDDADEAAGSGEYVSSVAWAADGKHLAVGLSGSEVQVWDSQRLKQVRALKGHAGRVGAMDWNGATLSTGGRDGAILNHDVRMRHHVTARLTGHELEVCGLKWSPSGRQLASGGNDNLLHIWDAAAMAPAAAASALSSSARVASGNAPWLHRLDQHQAAVKALAWCPFQANLLASGGGSADRTIKLWNTQTGACERSVDTESQVCALQWSQHDRELLSSHGYSRNQLCLWRYPSMTKVAELHGHSARVLHLAQSPDGATVASAAADETLRFWKAFGGPKGEESSKGGCKGSGSGSLERGFSSRSMSIR